MFGASQEYITLQWTPYVQKQMIVLQIPAAVNTEKYVQESINILNNKSYDEAVAYVKSLTKDKIMADNKGGSNTMLYTIGGGLLVASLLLLRKS